MIAFQTRNPEVNFDFSNATNFEVFSDLGLSSTAQSPPNYVTKLSGSTSDSTTGSFVINWYAELTNSGNNNISWYRLQWKRSSDGAWITLSNIDITISRANAFVPIAGAIQFVVSAADTIDFRLQFARGNGTARIQNANVYIFRVAL